MLTEQINKRVQKKYEKALLKHHHLSVQPMIQSLLTALLCLNDTEFFTIMGVESLHGERFNNFIMRVN